jgi:hypothetical protein
MVNVYQSTCCHFLDNGNFNGMIVRTSDLWIPISGFFFFFFFNHSDMPVCKRWLTVWLQGCSCVQLYAVLVPYIVVLSFIRNRRASYSIIQFTRKMKIVKLALQTITRQHVCSKCQNEYSVYL